MRSPTEAQSSTLSEGSREIVDRFTRSWDRALRGGPQPALESFLDKVPATDRTELKTVLELIDQDYVQRAQSICAGAAQQTVDIPDAPSGASKRDTKPDLDFTVDCATKLGASSGDASAAPPDAPGSTFGYVVLG